MDGRHAPLIRGGTLGGMRSRLLDLALIVGLVVVAGGIMWTLFNLGSTPRATDSPATTPRAATPTPSAPPTTPLSPDAASASPTTTTPGTTAAGDADAPPPTDASADPAATPTPAADPPPPRVVPPGTIALDRVGFSFVTGGPGACGVVLEAWVHVAVSRDLLASYGCGAEVLVTLDDPAGDRSEVLGVIGDTMNPSFELTVNVYVGEDEPAFEYGLTTGTFAPR